MTGTPDAQLRIDEWRAAHPEGTRAQMIADGVVSKTTAYRLWPIEDTDKKPRRKQQTKAEPQTTPAEDRSDRLTLVISPTDKQHLQILCATDRVTAAEWIARAIDAAWHAWDPSKIK